MSYKKKGHMIIEFDSEEVGNRIKDKVVFYGGRVLYLSTDNKQ